MSINLDIRWRLGARKTVEFEPELFSLLQEIESSGSLFSADKNMGVSYRYAWGLVREWSMRMGQPLAELQRGRGTKLTALGEKLLWCQRRINARLGPELESLASELNSEIVSLVEVPQSAPLRVYASHGLALGVLRDMLNADGHMHMDLQFRGSLESLRLFRAGKCDIAGFHFPYGEFGERLAPRYRQLIDLDQHALLHVVDREQGIMTGAGNPEKIRAITDLTRKGIRFINREPSAGTRVIFDALLQNAGIDPDFISGYGNEEFTHTAVAAIVASGEADAGFGIRAAAARLGLGFITLLRERYLFVLRREALRSSPVTRLCKVLRSKEFKKEIRSMTGYDATAAGMMYSSEELFS
jgi:Periplasmic molybdate-binding protein/domain